jgi:hypothetical protein
MTKVATKTKKLKITEEMLDETEDFVIPELEAARALVRNIPWVTRDDKVMKTYWGNVPVQSLVDYFKTVYPPHGRSRASLEHRACVLGLTRRRELGC